jgi:uncharacterized protein (DUF2342 family)
MGVVLGQALGFIYRAVLKSFAIHLLAGHKAVLRYWF